MNTEKIYDEQIAPLMSQIIELCNKHQIPFHASFFPSTGDESGHVRVTSHSAYESIHPEVFHNLNLLYWAAAAGGNLDVFMMAAEAYAKKHGHNSMYLALLESAKNR